MKRFVSLIAVDDSFTIVVCTALVAFAGEHFSVDVRRRGRAANDSPGRGGSRGGWCHRLVAPEAAAAPQVAPQRRDLSALLHGAIASPAS